jgi:hypothetical protein
MTIRWDGSAALCGKPGVVFGGAATRQMEELRLLEMEADAFAPFLGE